LKEFVKAKQ
jgi:hypothetical protein